MINLINTYAIEIILMTLTIGLVLAELVIIIFFVKELFGGGDNV